MEHVSEVLGNVLGALSPGKSDELEKQPKKKRKRSKGAKARASEDSDDSDGSVVPESDEKKKGGRQSKMEMDISELKTDLKGMMGQLKKVLSVVERVEELTVRVDRNEEKVQRTEDKVKKVDEMVKEGQDEMKLLRETNQHLVSRVEALENRLEGQEHKSVDLESRSRRNNLIIHGIPESEDGDETMRDSMKITRDFLRDKCKIREPVAIQRAHRIPTRRTNDVKNPRPMIALFLEHNDKMMVKEAVKKLPKDSGFRASDDLPKPIREARQRLNDDVMKHRRAGRDAWVIFPAKLIVDGEFVREEPVIPRQNPRVERRQRSPRREEPASRRQTTRGHSRDTSGERRRASPRPASRHGRSDQPANAWQDPPHRRRGYGGRRGRGGGGFRGGRDHSDRSPIRDYRDYR